MKLFANNPQRRLLDDSRRTRAMMWIMAIMLFLTVLAAALGLGMARAGDALGQQLAGRLTVQIVEPDPVRREAAARDVLAALARAPMVRDARAVPRERLAEMLKPWLGADGSDPDLPVPAMIDVDLTSGSDAAVARTTAIVAGISASARVDRHAAWMSPVSRFIAVLSWLSLGLVLLMATATTTVVLLASRSGLDTHRDTIGALHLLGATDVQVARLFQRRIAIDTLVGGLFGTVLALVTVAVLGWQAAALGSDLIDGIGLGARDWIVLLLLPLVFAGLAAVAARAAVGTALGRTL